MHSRAQGSGGMVQWREGAGEWSSISQTKTSMLRVYWHPTRHLSGTDFGTLVRKGVIAIAVRGNGRVEWPEGDSGCSRRRSVLKGTERTSTPFW